MHKALALDPSLAEAHASLGMCALYYDWDWMAAERSFRRSLELDPDSVFTRVFYSQVLAVFRRFDESIHEARRAADIDPLSVNAASSVALALYVARRHDEAIEAGRKALEIDPHFPSAYIYVALAQVAQNRQAEAVENAEKAAALTPHPHWRAHVGWLAGLAGRRDEALRILEDLKGTATHTYVSPYSFSIVYQGLGDTERWRAMMQACFEERNSLLTFLKIAPWNDPLRSDPSFQELVHQVGLP